MRIITIENKDYKIPGKWNELDRDQLLEVCRVLLLHLDKDYKKEMLFSYFTGLSYEKMRELGPTDLYYCLDVLDYLFRESKLSVNLLPEIEGMKGPDSGLTNFTFGQYFGESEAYYQLVANNKSQDALDSLINTMYNYNGGHENNIVLKKLPEPTKLAIFFFYQGCSNFIRFKFGMLFKTVTGAGKADGLEFARLVNSLNGGDISKNGQIKDTNLYEALTFLQTKMEQNGL
jgi:hypothetical protein